MSNLKSRVVCLAIATACVFSVHDVLARVKVNVGFNKAFDFKAVKTWGWDPEGPGQVKMARTQSDDPDAMKQTAEPWILSAVATEMTRRGLEQATSAPDVFVTYYLLLTTGMTAQTMGQFLPATTAWGLPPFAQATQSLEVMNQGSLVLDISAKGNVVWRGLAQTKIKIGIDDKKREALVREGVRDLLRRFPPKQ
jgi:hypothetical protein